MSKPVEIDAEQFYDDHLVAHEQLATEVRFTLETVVERAAIRTHSISARVKARASYLDKIDRKSYDDPIAQIDDIVGIRVVCLFTTDLPRIGDLVRENFTVLKQEDKFEGGNVDSFGYMSVHYVCTLHSSNQGARYDALKNLRFELQCRTILMDAWANVSHHLEYKGEASIPEGLRKDFYALAGLFYVADKHFEFFFREAQGSQDAAFKAIADEASPSPVHIDRDTIAALLASIYPGRKQGPLASVSELAQEVVTAGYSTVDEVRRDLELAMTGALAYEADSPPDSTPGRKFTTVGLARQALSIANKRFALARYGRQGSSRFDEYRTL